jgi:hypothetical protein
MVIDPLKVMEVPGQGYPFNLEIPEMQRIVNKPDKELSLTGEELTARIEEIDFETPTVTNLVEFPEADQVKLVTIVQ